MRFFAVSALAVVLICSCSHDDNEDITVKRTVSVRLEKDATTKVTGSDAALLVDEQKVGSVQIFVFNSDGGFEGSEYFSGITDNEFSEEIEVQPGEGKVFCALVNAVRMSSPASLASFEGSAFSLTDNGMDSIIMYGSVMEDILSSGSEVVIHVDRLIAKIVIGDISLDLSESRLQSVTISRIYLSNVVPSVSLDGGAIPSASSWYHRAGYKDEGVALEAFLSDGIGVTLRDGDSLGEQHSFYCCPNPTSADSRDTGGAYGVRYTRLVIETDCGWYNVSVGNILRNRIYYIGGIEITDEGGIDPEHNPDRASVVFDLDVYGWEDGADITENI